MANTEHDFRFMARALQLAAETVALASPNPQVGCVLVRNEQIIGEGAHLYDSFDHAEIAALKDAAARGLSPQGATAYVTLEPCSHHGRTGPCANTLIAAGITRCIVATADPNPLVSGQGIARLRAAGVAVEVGLYQDEARGLNEAFAHFIQHRTPFVTLKAALSVDGKLAPPAALRSPGQPHWLTGPEARAEVLRLRHASDAVLTGIGTILADDPALTDRTGLSRSRPLLRVILDTRLNMPLDSQLARSAGNDVLVFCASNALLAQMATLRASGVEIEALSSETSLDGRLNLKAVLEALGARNITSLLLECGPHLNGRFIREGLVDKAILFYTETELGERALPFADSLASPYLFEQRLRRLTRSTFGSDACVTGYLTDPWAGVP